MTMGWHPVTWAMAQKCPSPAAKLVLIKLADYADDEGCCWPSQGALAEWAGLTRECVNRIIKQLADAGLLRIESRSDHRGRLPNLYFLLCGRKSQGGSDIKSPPCDLASDLRSHKPPIEPPIELSLFADAHSESAPARDPDEEKPNGNGRRKPRQQFPEDWEPDQRDIDFALDEGRDHAWIAFEGARCRDHHRAKGNVFADHHAAWRTWVRNADSFAAPRYGNGGAGSYRNPSTQPGSITAAIHSVLNRRNLG